MQTPVDTILNTCQLTDKTLLKSSPERMGHKLGTWWMVLKREFKMAQRQLLSLVLFCLRQALGVLLVSLTSVRELKLEHRPVASH